MSLTEKPTSWHQIFLTRPLQWQNPISKKEWFNQRGKKHHFDLFSSTLITILLYYFSINLLLNFNILFCVLKTHIIRLWIYIFLTVFILFDHLDLIVSEKIINTGENIFFGTDPYWEIMSQHDGKRRRLDSSD